MRLLAAAEVSDLLSLPDAMQCLEETYREQARGQVTPWPPFLLRTEETFLRVTAGGLAARGRMGLRVNSSGPGANASALLYEVPSGRLLSLMAYPFSGMRLAASVALGVDRLAEPRARRVAMIGTGRNALGLLEAVCHVRPIETIEVFSRQANQRNRFAASAAGALNRSVVAVDSPETAVRKADIVLVATSSAVPAIRGAWLAPEAHVTAIGVRTELDEDVFRRASLVVTTSRTHEFNIHDLAEDWPLVKLQRSGEWEPSALVELGEVIAGQRTRQGGITVFREAQGGFSDIALATLVYERAVARGRGSEVSLD